MGKDWDKALPDKRIWKECLRVLKHGGFAYVMSAPRQDVLARMMIDLEDSGFNMGFTSMYWAYASGFPKSLNVGKAVDKKLGIEREVVGRNPNSRENCDKTNTIYESGTVGKTDYITKPTSDKAKKLDGSYAGFQPKPAVEVIIVCMKPLSEKGYVDQAMKDGKGVSWFDDCRIPLSKDTSIEDKRLVEGGSWDTSKTAENVYGKYEGKRVEAPMRKTTNRQPRNVDTVFKKSGFKSENNDTAEASPAGRFPANLIVSDDSLNDNIKHSSGKIQPHHNINHQNEVYGKYKGVEAEKQITYGDNGSFSRYYDLDAWYSQFIITPKASKSEKNKGLSNFEEKFNPHGSNIGRDLSNPKCHLGGMQSGSGKNNHPTVKPLKLMSYLITLGSREGDVVLDPFMGSGTTPLASKNMGRNYIGIEREEEYFKICCARVGDKPTILPNEEENDFSQNPERQVGRELTIEEKEPIVEEKEPVSKRLECDTCHFGTEDEEQFRKHFDREFHKRQV